jgi:hypothetical protein
MNLLTRGNDKIGSKVFAFNLPAVETCPGRSPCCEAHCYAQTGRWRFNAVREALAWNLRWARKAMFVPEVCEELRRRKVKVLRLHASGDFFDEAYVLRWLEILERSPGVRAYAYTRSWRVPAMEAALARLAALANFQMWYSADADTGVPRGLPPGCRVAWLMAEPDEPVPQGVDLVFRVRSLRKTPLKRIGLTLVCPTEQGREHSTTCTTCGVCWRRPSC